MDEELRVAAVNPMADLQFFVKPDNVWLINGKNVSCWVSTLTVLNHRKVFKTKSRSSS